MAGDYRIDGLAAPDSLSCLHDLLGRVGEDHPEVSADDLMLLETAVIEIAGNVVEHGRPPGQVRYVFELRVLPDRLEALLTDTGEAVTGTAPAPMPDGSAETGRGLPLARAALDELDYDHGADGNRWRMVKRCTGSGPATD
jgi:serine/threonine-protein kinase RsbW